MDLPSLGNLAVALRRETKVVSPSNCTGTRLAPETIFLSDLPVSHSFRPTENLAYGRLRDVRPQNAFWRVHSNDESSVARSPASLRDEWGGYHTVNSHRSKVASPSGRIIKCRVFCQLSRSSLGPSQRRQPLLHRRLQPRPDHRIRRKRSECRAGLARCFAPVGYLVAGDIMLAQKIALETNESGALAVANRILPKKSPPGCDGR